jgi:hypothetical protein
MTPVASDSAAAWSEDLIRGEEGSADSRPPQTAIQKTLIATAEIRVAGQPVVVTLPNVRNITGTIPELFHPYSGRAIRTFPVSVHKAIHHNNNHPKRVKKNCHD